MGCICDRADEMLAGNSVVRHCCGCMYCKLYCIAVMGR